MSYTSCTKFITSKPGMGRKGLLVHETFICGTHYPKLNSLSWIKKLGKISPDFSQLNILIKMISITTLVSLLNWFMCGCVGRKHKERGGGDMYQQWAKINLLLWHYIFTCLIYTLLYGLNNGRHLYKDVLGSVFSLKLGRQNVSGCWKKCCTVHQQSKLAGVWIISENISK